MVPGVGPSDPGAMFVNWDTSGTVHGPVVLHHEMHQPQYRRIDHATKSLNWLAKILAGGLGFEPRLAESEFVNVL
jgi:hypothetical protein